MTLRVSESGYAFYAAAAARLEGVSGAVRAEELMESVLSIIGTDLDDHALVVLRGWSARLGRVAGLGVVRS